ncbi:MAG: hypothetical protein V3V01_12445 [Acidimicrobiales bacterium]
MKSIPTDPLEVLRSARDTAHKIQELASKLTLPSDQRKALAENLALLVMPGEQLSALIDLADTFGPPHTQIEEIRETLAAQREVLEAMLEDTERINQKVERLATAAEQIAAAQAPLRALLTHFEKESEE